MFEYLVAENYVKKILSEGDIDTIIWIKVGYFSYSAQDLGRPLDIKPKPVYIYILNAKQIYAIASPTPTTKPRPPISKTPPSIYSPLQNYKPVLSIKRIF